MKPSRATVATALTAATFLDQAHAFPQLHTRQAALASEAAGLVKAILGWFGVAFPEVVNAWDYGADVDLCSIKMETQNGGNCKASVTCADGVTNEYNPGGAGWQACYVGGRQYFNDPRIGDFSIAFSQKDGEGEGLTNPILQLAYVDNWAQFPVYELSQAYGKAKGCEKGTTPINCDKGPFICRSGDDGFSQTTNTLKKWECGVPVVGKGGPEGTAIDSNGPVNDRGYAEGWCVAHITQYQKADPAVDAYALDAKIYDNNENEIGGTTEKAGPTLSLASLLPYTLEVSTGGIDDDPVSFRYGDQSWNSNDVSRACSVGAYDSGSRQLDCGFNC